MKNLMVDLVDSTQDEIVKALSRINEKEPTLNPWKKEGLGEGLSVILPHGKIFESGGVNVSKVSGKVFPEMLKMLKIEESLKDGLHYFATGVSLVLHPYSPMIPTVHMNYRYFEITQEGKKVYWFFGGGSDLTPYYLFEEDPAHFHTVLKQACDTEDSQLYSKLKKECDDYFYLPHRNEHRGIGGIFCLRRNDKSEEEVFKWAKACAGAFLPSYMPIVERRKMEDYEDRHHEWQRIRRGRYVEFNLLYDVGTSFGLKSKGNANNILMSLPPQVIWKYDDEPAEGTDEAKMLYVLKNKREWI